MTNTDTSNSCTGKHVIIVGAGAFGASAACALLQRGYRVQLFDRSPNLPAPDASSTDLNKCIRCDYGPNRLYTRMALQSIQRWTEWQQNISTTKTDGVLFDQCGWLVLSESTLDQAEFERSSMEAVSAELNATISGPNRALVEFKSADGHQQLQLDHLAAKFPAFKAFTGTDAEFPFKSGYWNRLGGFVRSGYGVRLLLDRAIRMGVELITGNSAGCVQKLLDGDDDDGEVGIQTADGRRHLADQVVVCTGAWSTKLIPQLHGLIEAHGQPVIHIHVPHALRERYSSPQLPVFAFDISKTGFYGFPVDPETGLFKIGLHSSGYTNGDVSVPQDYGDSVLPRDALEKFRGYLRRYLPELCELPIARSRMCWYSDSWDGNFYIDFLPPAENISSNAGGKYLIATGGSGHGFKFAPVLGDLIADVLEGKPNEFRDAFKWRPCDAKHSGSTSERAADTTGPQSLSCAELVPCQSI